MALTCWIEKFRYHDVSVCPRDLWFNQGSMTFSGRCFAWCYRVIRGEAVAYAGHTCTMHTATTVLVHAYGRTSSVLVSRLYMYVQTFILIKSSHSSSVKQVVAKSR